MHREKILVALCLALIVAAAPIRAQDGQLTLEQLFDPEGEQLAEIGSLPRARWLDDGHYALPSDGAEDGWQRVEARTGRVSPLYPVDAFEKALLAEPGLGEEDVAAVVSGDGLTLLDDGGAALFHLANDLFHYRFDGSALRRLTRDPVEEVGEDASPDGRMVAYVSGHDLWVVPVSAGAPRPLTDGGSEELLFGRLDWVYQEEVYGRGNFKGFWWSPDSRSIAFLRLDESPVREFTVIDHLPTELEVEITNYPKAGSPNPKVALGVVPVAGGDTVWIDTSRYEPIEHLIVRVGWTPDSDAVVFQVQDREQRWLELLEADPVTGETKRILREESPAFVQVTGEPHWLDDGSFLWLSERSGFRHLYHYERSGELRRQLTQGEWEVAELHGVDEEEGRVYFSGTRDSLLDLHLYRVGLDLGEPERVTGRDGTHDVSFSPGFELYLDRWSDVTTPPVLTLHSADGSEIRTVEAGDRSRLTGLRLGEVEFLQVSARDGFPMEAMVIRPPDFDPTRRYPVLQYNYGGPHAPVVRNRWSGARYLWHQYLAQQGYVIWMCDNRSASGRGIAPTWEAYRRMGVIELRDIEDGIAWLKEQSWVDPERVGIWGWSYGGFMAAYALTHSESFKMGIAGAPVTDWRLYDTIYTERYMQMPQNNPEGYDETSVVEAAENLHGRLLLIHGTMDDNVHFQNSVQLIMELQKAGKEFELMIYPRSRHGIGDDDLQYHLYRTMSDFVERAL